MPKSYLWGTFGERLGDKVPKWLKMQVPQKLTSSYTNNNCYICKVLFTCERTFLNKVTKQKPNLGFL